MCVCAKTFNEITVANVPARGDRFTAPNPTKNWLEMYTQEADSVRILLDTTRTHTHTAVEN
jgi:hypothetical protein